jgi:stearoyl-CoA desaturase (Delta-9 desaturase)
MSPRTAAAGAEEFHNDIIYPSTLPFVFVHLACFAALWTGVTVQALVLCGVLYVVRMFGVTAGYHRYFSHRSFKTSRPGQFLLACLAQSSTQKGVMWWAAIHRHHHKHSDTESDVHSPRHAGFWYSHVGWIFDSRNDETEQEAVPDLARYPELLWLDRYPLAPAVVLALGCLLFAGWSGLVVGFFWSTVLLYHGTFSINSLAHVHGTKRYLTGDDSRNNWWLAILTLGEGWHNNHHAYQRSTRQGFRWWEFDPTYYVLKLFSWAGLVWELGEPPREVVTNERRPGRAVIEKVARQLAASFPVAAIAARVQESWAHSPSLAELRERMAAGQVRVEELLAEVHLPHLPTMAQIRSRAEEMYAATPSLDEVAERARELILHAVSDELLAGGAAEGTA